MKIYHLSQILYPNTPKTEILVVSVSASNIISLEFHPVIIWHIGLGSRGLINYYPMKIFGWYQWKYHVSTTTFDREIHGKVSR